MAGGVDDLTDKEKEALRLLLLGHDAKSMAKETALSVHTINERLRQARRKLEVTSSKEAARLLLEHEGEHPHPLVYKDLGEDADADDTPEKALPENGGSARIFRAAIIAGVCVMSLIFATLALGLLPGASNGYEPAEASRPAELEAAARHWLELVDAGDAEASYALTSASFQQENTLEAWATAMNNVRGSLGATLSRELLSVDALPTPEGYSLIRFRTTFENLQGLDLDPKEILTLVEEDGEWRVVGIHFE